MEYSSFYGGRRGASFVITRSFRTIAEPAADNEGFNKIIKIDMGLEENAEISPEIRKQWLNKYCMITCFKQGSAYKEVNYDEYVIIDAYNKNDENNGKIYRRGYDYNNEVGGAIYVGQIVGPAGMAAHTLLANYEDVINMTTKDGLETQVNPDGSLVEDSNKTQYRKTQNSLEVKDEKDGTGDLIPGQYFDEEGEHFNDTIDYVACSIKDFESHESTVYIGFKIPYLVNIYTSESVSPYYHRNDMEPTNVSPDKKWEAWDKATNIPGGTKETNDFVNKELIQRTDDLSHPFFSKWNISIPKGIKGDTFKNLRVTTVEQCIEEGKTLIDGNNKKIQLQDYEGYADDSTTASWKKRQILVYDYYNYDRVAGGDPVALYLGDFNVIDNFRIDDDGTIVIEYSHDNTDVYPSYLKAVKEIQLNTESGLLQVDYNFDQQYERDEDGNFKLDAEGNKIPLPNTETHYETYLTWVKDIHFDELGTITWEYTTPKDDRTDNNKVKWVKGISLNQYDGTFTIDFNYDQEYEVNQGEDITTKGVYKLDADGNKIPKKNTKTQYVQNLQWVRDIEYAQDGTLTWRYTYKDGKRQKVETKPNFLKWVEGVKLNPLNGKFEMDFNYETEPDGAVDFEGNDISGQPTHYEASLTWVKDVLFQEDGTVTLLYTDQPATIYNNHIKWVDHIEFNNETGHFKVVYNYDEESDGTPTEYNADLQYVKNVIMDDDGTITFEYTGGKDDTIFSNALKTIKSITLNSTTGDFVIKYNYGNDYTTTLEWVDDIELLPNGDIKLKYTGAHEDVLLEGKVIYPKKIVQDNGDKEGTGTQKLIATYNNGDTEEISPALNYIMETAVSDDYHLLVWNSDPQRRQALIDANKDYYWENKEGWQDLGSIKAESGILIGLNLSKVEHPELNIVETAIPFLNDLYPSGLRGVDLKGKVITAGDGTDGRDAYAFDYTLYEGTSKYRGWYYLGEMAKMSTPGAIAGKLDSQVVAHSLEQMPVNSLWFVVEDILS